MEGSQVTVIVSVVGGVVGLIALTVAWSQMRIASAKVKLDLYNKRFSVYVAALELYQCACTNSRDGIKDKFNKLTQACRESRFLFDGKDGVHETLIRIQKAGGIILTQHESKLDPLTKNDLVRALYEKSVEAFHAMEKDILALEEQLKDYLSFHNVRGWTFF
jgi:hypothetical protein